MNMNKTLLAVALATAGLSANVMALTFTDGEFNGSVDIGGTITVPVATNQWQWATGTGLDAHTHSVTVMTNGYKTLTINKTANTPLLVGQTKAATVGGVGITPQISFMQADGTTPAVIAYAGTADGKGVMSLQVVDGTTPTTVLGTADVHVNAAALAVGTNEVNEIWGNSIIAGVGGNVFTSASHPVPVTTASALAPTLASSWVSSLGGKDRAQLIADNITLSGVPAASEHVGGIGSYTLADPAVVHSVIYGLGIAAGDNIVVNFNSPVATTTQWKAPLRIAVTYL